MKTRTLFLTGAALALLGANEASAAPTYCTTGSLNACASVVVEKFNDLVLIRVRNLQGQVANDNTWYSGINALQIFVPGLNGFSDFTTTTAGGVNMLGPAASWWAAQYDVGWLYLWANGATAGIVGCGTGVGAPNTLGHYQTCDSDSWVVFGFRTQQNWDLSQMTLRWYASAYGSPTDYTPQTVVCDPRVAGGCAEIENHTTAPEWITLFAPESSQPANVTPEPVTLALLGTGLAGVGAAARRRRKQQQDGDSV